MPYIKPNKSSVRYEVEVTPTKSQSGYAAVLFIGEDIPDVYDYGFKYYDDDDNLISDLSKYKYCHAPNLYSVKYDELVVPEPNNDTPVTALGTNYISDLTKSISDLQRQVDDMQTYTETKPVYIDDEEVIFEVDEVGAVTAQLTVNGIVTPCQFLVDGNYIVVTFDKLEEVGEVTIFVVK